MPNRFQDRENGESTNFPRRSPEQERFRTHQSWQSNPREWQNWESEYYEPPWEGQESYRYPRGPESYGSRSSGFRGEYGPAPRHTYRGRTIQESYGAYPGQQFQRGVYGYETEGRGEQYRSREPHYFEGLRYESENAPYDPNYKIGQSMHQQWMRERYPGSEYERPLRWPEKGRFSGRGPKGYKRSDDRIEEEINERLTEHPDLDATEISVHVQNCDVTLSGTVEDRYMKRLAEDIAASVSGVSDVQNQIRVNRNAIQ